MLYVEMLARCCVQPFVSRAFALSLIASLLRLPSSTRALLASPPFPSRPFAFSRTRARFLRVRPSAHRALASHPPAVFDCGTERAPCRVVVRAVLNHPLTLTHRFTLCPWPGRDDRRDDRRGGYDDRDRGRY